MIFLPVDIVKVNARSESVVVETLAPVRGIKVLFLWKIATIKSEIAFSFSTDGKEWHLRPNFTLFLVTATQIPYCTLFLSYKNIAFPAWAEYSYFSAFIKANASSKVVNFKQVPSMFFSCQNSQFPLPQNFISQIDRRSFPLSQEYHFYIESHVPGRDFRRLKQTKLRVAINWFRG